MMRILVWLSILSFVLFVVSCGYQTPPVPYTAAEASLPEISFEQPVFKGKWLQLVWNEVPARSFVISVFRYDSACHQCEQKALDRIEIDYEDHGVILKAEQDMMVSGGIRYHDMGNSHLMLIDKSYVSGWSEMGYVYLTIAYRDEDGVLSQPSSPIRPIVPAEIALPEVSIDKKHHDGQSDIISITLTWRPTTESIIHEIRSNGVRTERTNVFGLNLYKPGGILRSQQDIKINSRPLKSGKIMLTVGNEDVLATHVDRFGNESEKILINTSTGKDEVYLGR